MKTISTNYRTRVYAKYVSSMDRPLPPATLEGFRPRSHLVNKIIRDHFPQDQSAVILDLGCGHGAFVYLARQAGYKNIRGVDGSPEQVAEARRLGIDGVTEGDLMEALQSLEDGSLDCVVAFDVIEHFTKEELILFVDEVYRVLRDGSRWIIHTANAESPFGERLRYGDFTHELSFTHKSITQLFVASAFSEVRSYEDQPVPHGIKSATRWVLWKLIRSALRLYTAVETGDIGRNCIFTQTFVVVATK